MGVLQLEEAAARLHARGFDYGDAVVLCERGELSFVTLAPGGVHRSQHGVFPHAALAGCRPGARISSTDGRRAAWLQLLRPTAELWTRVLRHRTQILYAPDIAAVVARLRLRPGCTVLETGTGSGSLTTSLARAVAPGGRVLSFEFHAERAAAARADFAATGLAQTVSVFVRDTEATGFPASLAGCAHAVFLDLPGPHRVAAAAAAALTPGGTLCSFSPCIEQVQRLVAAAAEAGLVDARTFEVLDREHCVGRRGAALLPPPRAGEAAAAGAGKRKREAGEGEGAEGGRRAEGGAERGQAAGPSGASARWTGGSGAARAAAAAPPPVAPRQRETVERAEAVVTSWPLAEARGHTGFLTFVRKPV